jgi:RNA polymerase sigma-70 factor, ECF subfamily
MADSSLTTDGSFRAALAQARAGDSASMARVLMIAEPAVRADAERDFPRRHSGVLSVDDVVQQTFVDSCRDIASFRGETTGELVAWSRAIARQNLRDAVRLLDAAKRGGPGRFARGASSGGSSAGTSVTGGRTNVERAVALRESSIALARELAGARGPSTSAATDEAAHLLTAAIRLLPEVYRVVVEGFDLAGRTMEDVATQIGRSVGAAYMIRARAHRLLRDALGSSSRFFSRAS